MEPREKHNRALSRERRGAFIAKVLGLSNEQALQVVDWHDEASEAGGTATAPRPDDLRAFTQGSQRSSE